MPRKKSPPSYLIHKRWNRAFTIIDRRQIPLGPANSPESLKKFDEILSRYYGNGRQLPPDERRNAAPVSKGPILSDLLDAFLTQTITSMTPRQPDDGSPRGRVRNNRRDKFISVIRILAEMYEDHPTAEFGLRELAAVRRVMIDPSPTLQQIIKPGGWCRNYIAQQIQRIREIFRWGAGIPKLVPPSVPAELDQLPPLKPGEFGVRETDEVEAVATERALAILPHVSDPVAAMLKLQLEAGMRSTEICIMRPKDIRQAVDGVWFYQPAFHKTQHAGKRKTVRAIPLYAEAQEIIRPFLKGRDPEAFLFSPAEAVAKQREEARKKRLQKNDYIQPSQLRRSEEAAKRKKKRAPGNRYTQVSYYQAIRRGCELAFGMPKEFRPAKEDRPAPGDTPEVLKQKAARRQERQAQRNAWLDKHAFHPHQLRHNAGFRYRREYGLDAAQVQLGHTTTRMTERYAPPDVEAVAMRIAQAKAKPMVEQAG